MILITSCVNQPQPPVGPAAKISKTWLDTIRNMHQPYSRLNNFDSQDCGSIRLGREYIKVLPKIDFVEWADDTLYTRLFKIYFDTIKLVALESVTGNDLFFYGSRQLIRYNCGSEKLPADSEFGIDYSLARYYYDSRAQILVIIAVPSRFTGTFTNYSLLQKIDLARLQLERRIVFTDSLDLPLAAL